MKNDYKAENVVRFINDFIEQEEHFDSMFFEKLACMFTTLAHMCEIDADTYACNTLIKGLWEDIKENCDLAFPNEDYDKFYDMMIKWIV